MAKQIKIIKCPQCGNTKPLLTAKDQYRCDKCGTEFFLDTDDVTVNVNHRYQTTGGGSSSSGTSMMKGVVILLMIGFILAIVIIFAVTTFLNSSRRTTKPNTRARVTTEAPKIEPKKYLFSILPARGKGHVFYVTNRSGSSYAVFQDIITGKVLKEQKLGMTIDKKHTISHRWFMSDEVDYVIVDERLIFKIDPDSLAFINLTAQICASKPALEAGIMSASFVPEGRGDGFLLNTNLGKALYYFPTSDMLYTEKAFEHLAKDNSSKTLSGAGQKVYYLFQNRESVHSSNVAQLFEVTYTFNNGGPEDRLMELKQLNANLLEKHRITACRPITDERVYFSPKVLYYDKQNILIVYYPSLAEHAVPVVELLDTTGKVIWKIPLKEGFESVYTVRTPDGFMLQTGENAFYRITADGRETQVYKLP